MHVTQIKDEIPFQSPVQPTQLTLESNIQFDCHPGVSCFNACCKSIDITLTPYDILRLRKHLGLTSQEFVAGFTTPYEMDHHGMPGLKLLTKPGKSECMFLQESGCSVYGDRPAACRYYALGSMGMRKKDDSVVEDIYFSVKEAYCRGHEEPKTLTVRQYRHEQGVERYDEMNREWRDIIIKKRSSGPTTGTPSERSFQLFDMCSYDLDSFREFIQSPGFQSLFQVDPQDFLQLKTDDEALLQFAMAFLKQVLFGEKNIPMKPDGREQRIAERSALYEERRRKAVEDYKSSREAQWKAEEG
ncbi:MAG: YkgJ family cysteine cluster protein [Gammaproteobacteria bacterium]|jgi:Fe-S-cluster containining protein